MSQLQSVDFQAFSNVTITAAAETVAGASVATAVESPTVKCSVKVLFVMAPGTGTTGVSIRIYRGPVPAGSPIGTPETLQAGFTPGSFSAFQGFASDPLSNAGQAQYCFTVQQTGATTNGVISLGFIETMVLSG